MSTEWRQWCGRRRLRSIEWRSERWFSGDKTWSGMIAGVAESRRMVRVRPKTVLVDQSTLWKMLVFSAILLVPSNVFSNSDRDFLGKFPAIGGFLCSVSRMGFVPGCVENPLESLMFPVMAWAGRTESLRSILCLHFIGSPWNFYSGFSVTEVFTGRGS